MSENLAVASSDLTNFDKKSVQVDEAEELLQIVTMWFKRCEYMAEELDESFLQ
jgi:hypothetical protein